MAGAKREPSSLVQTTTSIGRVGLVVEIVQGADDLEPGQHAVVAVELAAGGLGVDMAAGHDRRQRIILAGPAGEDVAHLVDGDGAARLLAPVHGRDRAPGGRDRSSARRQTPPFSVAPIFASSIRLSHSRSPFDLQIGCS